MKQRRKIVSHAKSRRGLVRRCSRCGEKNDRPLQRYCFDCQAAYMRKWRKTHKMNEGQRARDAARSYANVFKKRGKLVQQSCCVCDAPKTEMHHVDHERPLAVTWFCRPCHLAWHSFSRDMIQETFENWIEAVRQDVVPQRKAA